MSATQICKPLLRWALLILLPALAASPQGGRAAVPVAYAVAIAPTGDARLDQALADASTLVSLRGVAPVGAFGLVARARGDIPRLVTVLQSFGYYDGAIRVTVAGRPAEDPDLPAALDALAPGAEVPGAEVPGAEVQVAVAAVPGRLFVLGRIDLAGAIPAAVQGSLGLSPGDPARAADVLAAGQRLQDALRAQGHALARVDPPTAALEPGAGRLDVRFVVTAGPRVDLGAIEISVLEGLDDAYVRRRLGLQPGEPYDPARIAQARQDLLASGAIGGAQVTTADALDGQGRVPVRVEVSERKRRAVNLSAAWSTDQGGSLSAGWTHRNLFGGAEQLAVAAAATGLGGSANRTPGYNIGAMLTLPDWQRRDQSLVFNLQGVKESLRAYDRTAALGGVTLQRRLSPQLTASLGVALEEAEFRQEGAVNDYSLLQLPIGLTLDTTTSPFDPTGGIRAKATVTPSISFGSTGTANFVILQASAAGYFDFGTAGRSVLALRALVGSTEGAGVLDLPPDQRFYAGGGGTIRGYRFQSVGPAFASGNPLGGTSVDAATVEWRQRFGADWGAAAFLDVGQVGRNGMPFAGDLRAGAGVGARYYTPIGPIRFDIAVPLVHARKNDILEVYIGIGQAF